MKVLRAEKGPTEFLCTNGAGWMNVLLSTLMTAFPISLTNVSRLDVAVCRSTYVTLPVSSSLCQGISERRGMIVTYPTSCCRRG